MRKIFIVFTATFILVLIFLNFGYLATRIAYFAGHFLPKKSVTSSPQKSTISSVPEEEIKDLITKHAPSIINRSIVTDIDVDDSATLIIPSINISAPIIFSKSKVEADLQNDLEKGVVLYPGSSAPGTNGLSVIIGHSSAYPWHEGKYGHIFSLLDRLSKGDKIIIVYQREKIVYSVVDKIKAKPGSKQLSQTENANLVLLTCWPVGTNTERVAITANLTK